MRRSTSLYKNKDVTDEEDDDDDEDEEDEEEDDEDSSSAENMMIKRSRTGVNDVVLKKGGSSSSSSSSIRISCQAENCSADMGMEKRYHQRHKVCEYHAKAPMVRVASLWQRFCQQCSRFHEVAEFDEAKRSCRRRLAGHNQRRRKSSSYDPH